MYRRAIIALALTACCPVAACGRGADAPAASPPPHLAPSGASPSATAATPAPGSALTAEARRRLEDEVRRELREELRPLITAELRRELTPLVRRELARESSAAPADENAPRAAPDDAGAPDDVAGKHAHEPAPADLWTRPGTRIWPSGGGLKLVDLRVAAALEDKLPADVRSHYPNTPEVLYCYTVFENPSPEATVTHVWRRGSRLVSRVELEVSRSPKWRTWSKQRTQPHWTGLWSCEVLGSDGQQLGLTVIQIGG
jgi:hypothetical protein